MTILTTKAFVYSATGFKSYAFNTVYTVSDDLGEKFINSGLAVEYTGLVVEPTETKGITFDENGEYTEDVKSYAYADITVNLPNGNEVRY